MFCNNQRFPCGATFLNRPNSFLFVQPQVYACCIIRLKKSHQGTPIAPKTNLVFLFHYFFWLLYSYNCYHLTIIKLNILYFSYFFLFFEILFFTFKDFDFVFVSLRFSFLVLISTTEHTDVSHIIIRFLWQGFLISAIISRQWLWKTICSSIVLAILSKDVS